MISFINQQTEKQEFPDRIPYESWANSQLSIVKFYGAIILGTERYVLDYDNAPKKVVNGEERFFPELVKAKLLEDKS